MAKYIANLPDDLIKAIESVEKNTEDIFGAMTRAGAEVVAKNAKANAPASYISKSVKLSKTYKTPSDGGINTKVYFSGYLPFKGNRTTFIRKGGNGRGYTTNKGVPIDFLVNLYEYGRSTSPFPKKPFFRKSFKKQEIEKAMIETQKKASGGLLDE